METVEILGMKVNVVPDTSDKMRCDVCVFDNDTDRCAAHHIVIGGRCAEDDFHFEKPEEDSQ